MYYRGLWSPGSITSPSSGSTLCLLRQQMKKMLLGVFMNGSLLDVSVNGARPPIRIQNSQLKNVMTPLVHPIFLAVVAPPLQINSCVVFLGKAATIVD